MHLKQNMSYGGIQMKSRPLRTLRMSKEKIYFFINEIKRRNDWIKK